MIETARKRNQKCGSPTWRWSAVLMILQCAVTSAIAGIFLHSGSMQSSSHWCSGKCLTWLYIDCSYEAWENPTRLRFVTFLKRNSWRSIRRENIIMNIEHVSFIFCNISQSECSLAWDSIWYFFHFFFIESCRSTKSRKNHEKMENV